MILWPEVKPVTRLVAPPPKGLSTGTALARSFSIPFAGQYLLFRFPQRRPPPTSILQRGSPATLAFSTVDHWPLNMEAIQKLDEPIDLSCCSAMRVEIWNADKYPGTVTLELYANDKLLGARRCDPRRTSSAIRWSRSRSRSTFRFRRRGCARS